ncbi:nuclear transport factor 2 family protein [Aeromonas sobria]|uniref:Steroid delta-isomerase n=1 Tax=Aeromonas sobria TaxID=646 RepID=A0A1S2CIP4_AERSO|nr:nuclear transport factor 2 family protein [Aeromonas sobria]EKP0261417.1 nuclear transport factor 2 family protein [Aeromonas sobria]MBS4687292.1 nuclear transport factor 2 family protein [Aeromonas sobria]OHY88580.1 steroid delta-isomerase [Aeromonas sobria]HEH9400633.1 nuclear transport factor 2 family protein [Aeromonas sobria]
MSITQPIEAQFEAYNAHDIDAFVACFAEDFKGYRMPTETPSLDGREALRAFYAAHRFNNPLLKAELVARTLLGNKVFDHELIYGLSPEPIESVAVFEVEDGLIKTAWFYFPS